MATDFPRQGDDMAISLRNSQYPQFDRAWSEALRDDYPEIWRAGGNIRGNDAFRLWGEARDGSEAPSVLDWIREREAWAARHYEDGDAFVGSDAEDPNLSNIAGVVAWVKWGVIGQLGARRMKEVLNEMKKKIDAEKLRKTGAYRELSNYETKTLPTFVVKADEAQGIIEQVVAVMGNIDDGDDIIDMGAFVKTIEENGRRIRVLDNHNAYSIHDVVGKPLRMREIGRDELPESVLRYAPDATGGLLAVTQYAMGTQKGREAFTLVSGGFVPESSIGYDPVQHSIEEIERGGKRRSVRHLKEIRLWEYSNVLWGMNPATAVVSAKRKEEEQMSKTKDEQPETKAVLTYQDLPLAARDRAWDDTEAEASVRNWASDGTGELADVDWGMYQRAFFYRDPESSDQAGGYKLGYAEVIDGELTAVPRGIFAVAGALEGARGGIDIPEAEQERIKGQVSRYYAKMREEFDDDSLVPSWERGEMGDDKSTESKERGRPNFGDYLQGCLHKMYTSICDGTYIHGLLDRDQRKLLSSIAGDMLDVVYQNMPQEIYNMPYDSYGYEYMAAQIDKETKAGRAISKANAARIQATIDQIHAAATALEEMISDAVDMEDEPPQNDDMGMDEEDKGRDTEAGPPNEAPTETAEQLAQERELLMQKIQLDMTIE